MHANLRHGFSTKCLKSRDASECLKSRDAVIFVIKSPQGVLRKVSRDKIRMQAACTKKSVTFGRHVQVLGGQVHDDPIRMSRM